MGTYLQPADLAPYANIPADKAAALIEDAEVFAIMAAPPLANPGSLTTGQRAAVRTILRRAVVREADSGTRAKVQETAGPFAYTMDTRRPASVSFLTGDEEDALRVVVGIGRSTVAYTVDLTPVGWDDWDPIRAWLTAEGE